MRVASDSGRTQTDPCGAPAQLKYEGDAAPPRGLESTMGSAAAASASAALSAAVAQLASGRQLTSSAEGPGL